ncbi:MAG: prepilin-type N-terminal cleavage/methylation domain-containing protein [Phycisphaera sp.]|nr:prepilin-type N-terminal cleavage/methylation domain-containing protein [Phycisphaera sp.]
MSQATPVTTRIRRGFTLVELMVVTAILIVLITILMNSYEHAKSLGQLTYCSTNHRQLMIAYFNYATDHRQELVGAYTSQPGDWVYSQPGETETPDNLRYNLTMGTHTKGANDVNVISENEFYQYLHDLNPYHCPSDIRDYIRSYSINGFLNGHTNDFGPINPVNRLSALKGPSRTIAFIDEDDPRKANMNSWVIRPHGYSTEEWVDWVGGYHNVGKKVGGSALSFGDGHVEVYWFQDPKAMLEITGFFWPAPNSPDLEWFRDRYNPGDINGNNPINGQ